MGDPKTAMWRRDRIVSAKRRKRKKLSLETRNFKRENQGSGSVSFVKKRGSESF